MGLAKVGLKGVSLGSKNKGGKSTRSFVLRTYIVGGVGVRESQIDWWVKMVPASPGDMTTQT